SPCHPVILSGYSRSPISYRIAAVATIGAVSARSVRGPSVTAIISYRSAVSNSLALKPPSGPLKSATEKGCAGDAGEEEKGRPGDKETGRCSLSPCLLVSLSLCPSAFCSTLRSER